MCFQVLLTAQAPPIPQGANMCLCSKRSSDAFSFVDSLNGKVGRVPDAELWGEVLEQGQMVVWLQPGGSVALGLHSPIQTISRILFR